MRKLLIFFSFFIAVSISAQIQWLTINQALENQKINPKKILINFYSEDCQTCIDLENHTFTNHTIKKIITNSFYAVKFDIKSKEQIEFLGRIFVNDQKDGVHNFSKFMNINSTPTIVFFDEYAQPITNLMGSFTAKDAEPYFTLISKNDYKKIKTRQQWDNHQKKIKSK